MMPEVTMCLLSCGEDTESECLDAISEHRGEFVFHEIRNISPQSIALNQMIAQCNTPYLIPLDSDFLLYKGFWNRILTEIEKAKTDSKWHSILFSMWDTLTLKKVRSLKIFKTEVVKQYPYKDVRHPDRSHFLDLTQAGYHAIEEPLNQAPIGSHVVRGSKRCYSRYKDIYLCKRAADLCYSDLWKSASEDADFFEKRYCETGNEDFLWCILGIYDGLTCKYVPESKASETEIIYQLSDIQLVTERISKVNTFKCFI